MAVTFEASFGLQPLREFVGTGPLGLVVRSLVTLPTTVVEVLDVECTATTTFDDLAIVIELASFKITSTFDNAFPRPVKYLIQTTEGKQFVTALDVSQLPASFSGIYSILPPANPVVNIPFLITYRDQEGAPTWSAPKTTTWNLPLAINEQYTAQIIQTAVQQGAGYQNALNKFPELGG